MLYPLRAGVIVRTVTLKHNLRGCIYFYYF